MERVLSGVFHTEPSQTNIPLLERQQQERLKKEAKRKKKLGESHEQAAGADISKGVPSKAAAPGSEEEEEGEVSIKDVPKLDPSELWCCRGQAVCPEGVNPKWHIYDEFMRGFARSFSIAYTGKSLANLALSLLNAKARKNPLAAIQESLGFDALQFGAFVGTFSALFRSTNAFLAAFRGVDDPTNAFISGLVGGFSILLESSERRSGFALYLLVRATEIYIKQLVRQGYLPYWSHAEPFFFGVANMPIMYGFLFYPEILDSGYYRWILNMGVITDKGLKATLRDRREAFFQRGEITPFMPCSTGYHQGSCAHHVSTDWVYGLLRAFKIYLPVHLIPLLAFRFKRLLKDPVNTSIRTGKGILLSCMFLSSYVALVKGSQCFLRNLRQVDAGWHALVSGLLTGLACYFEQPSRVSELMLYCVPRGISATFKYFENQGKVHPIPYGEVALFSLAMALIMSRSKADFKPTYYNLLCYFLDTDNGESHVKKTQKSHDHDEDGEDDEKTKSNESDGPIGPKRVSVLSLAGKEEAAQQIKKDEEEEEKLKKLAVLSSSASKPTQTPSKTQTATKAENVTKSPAATPSVPARPSTIATPSGPAASKTAETTTPKTAAPKTPVVQSNAPN